MLLLIRHASAGDRDDWHGEDRARPLDDRGSGQAVELVDLLKPFALTRVLSSPAVRCIQTVEPLARRRGLHVETREELGEEEQERDGVALVRGLLEEDLAVCVHGGLSDALAGASQKKAQVLVLDGDANVVERLRP